MLQKSVIKMIKSTEKDYRPEDNVLMFSMESWMANQFIIDLSKHARKWMKSKAEKWILPWFAPIWYLNNRLEHTIYTDVDRFPLVRKMWDLMLTGNYSVPKIRKIANDEWWLRTVKTKRRWWTPLSVSSVYKLFSNMFYAWVIEWNWEQYAWTQESMITLEEYDRVQELLWRKWKARPKKHEFAYTWIIRCWECLCLVTAETKTKYIRNTNEMRSYTYYHCTRRKEHIKCIQRKNISEINLEKQIANEISKYTILPEFKDWALDILKSENEKEVDDRSHIYENLNKTLEINQRKLDRLTDLLVNETISESEYKRKKSELKKEIKKLRDQMDQTDDRTDHWIELTEKAFNFATYGKYHFENGDLKTKKEIFSALGQNFLLKDWILSLEANEWLVPIWNNYPDIEMKYRMLEPLENGLDKRKNTSDEDVILLWQAKQSLNRTCRTAYLDDHIKYNIWDYKAQMNNWYKLYEYSLDNNLFMFNNTQFVI